MTTDLATSTGGDTNAAQPVWLTAEEVAGLLRVHVTTVHELCRRGELPAIKAGRDWRVSARGLSEKAELGDVHNRLIQQTAALSAEKTAARVLASFADALTRELAQWRPEVNG